jgi:hypothetical protein
MDCPVDLDIGGQPLSRRNTTPLQKTIEDEERRDTAKLQ